MNHRSFTGGSDQAFVDKVEKLARQDLLACYQCGKCSAGCPMAKYMDILPNQMIRFAQLGMRGRAAGQRCHLAVRLLPDLQQPLPQGRAHRRGHRGHAPDSAARPPRPHGRARPRRRGNGDAAADRPDRQHAQTHFLRPAAGRRAPARPCRASAAPDGARDSPSAFSRTTPGLSPRCANSPRVGAAPCRDPLFACIILV